MKVVLDTGIFISSLVSDKGFPFQAVSLWVNKEFDLITSTWQLNELREVSRYPRIVPIIKSHQAGQLINRISKYATALKDLPEVDYSPDPKDNPILSTGIEGQVQYIVSGDKKDMVKLGKVKGIPIITVREFIGQFIELEN